jgi:ubiquinone/menaquinone biosynthesis C-methylase UbiE
MKNTSTSKKIQKADHYDDDDTSYLRYWDGRDYEQAAEEIAIRRMLKGMKFKHGVDVGGGYGRLSVVLKDYADKVTLAEPSKQQIDISKDFLKGKPAVEAKLAQAEKLPFKDGEIDLAMVIRVIHHLPDPTPAFQEISRVLKKDGYFLIEFANYANFKNRIKHALKFQRMPIDPIDIKTAAGNKTNSIPFVNHNPRTVRKQLAQSGFKVEKVLSVSNFRSATLKKFIPKSLLVKFESALQKPLAKTYFGPSTVYLLRKV